MITSRVFSKRVIGGLLLALAMGIGACDNSGKEESIFDKQILSDAESALSEKEKSIGLEIDPFEGLTADSLSQEEKNAMTFLYAYMPLPDIMDHSRQFHLDNVRAAFAAKAEQTWGKDMPGYLFRHYVLPLRVNNEVPDDFRTVYFRELNDLVKGMSMTDAALEVNHWAHQHITYTPTDGRTRPATATLKNALGRCGEQSVFLVAALRTVGIPARQIYTPRWAHTDNNHAWVEAWVDGEWHYLGASEPAPVLDNAWFDAPVLRAMLLTTYAFGDYKGPEEWLDSTAVHTALNVSDNYIPTAPAKVRVLNPDGTPAEGAEVTFRLYNYAELYPLVTRTTNKLGEASVKLGLGDIVVYASKGDLMAMKELTVSPDAEVLELKLDTWEAFPTEQHFALTPPVEKKPEVLFTKEQEEANNKRLEENTRIRTAYTDTFLDEEEAQAMASGMGLTGSQAEEAATYLVTSRGNHESVAAFLAEAQSKGRAGQALSLLSSLMQKDLEDISLEVLQDAFNRDLADEAWKDKDLISPRVFLEHIYPVEKELEGFVAEIVGNTTGFTEMGTEERAKAITAQVASMWVDDTYNPQHIAMSPVSTWKLKGGDEMSLTVLLVRLLRSAGIPARYDSANGVVLFRNDDGKESILPFLKTEEEETPEAACTLALDYTPEGFLKTPQYYVHYTVNYLSPDGKLDTYAFADYTKLRELEGQKILYDRNLLSTGTREADGTARYALRKLPCGERTALQFDFDENAVNVIGELNSEALYMDAQKGEEKSILSTTGRGYFVLLLVKPNHEPSDHILRDIKSLISADGHFPLPILALTHGTAPAKELSDLLPEAVWGTDTHDILGQIARGTEHEMPLDYPVVVVSDTFNRVVYFSQGYTIGIGDTLSRVISTVTKE